MKLPPHNPTFMFRNSEITRILDAISQGKSVLLTGIRRTGKTSVVKEVLHQQTEFSPVMYLDVQDYVSLDAFYRDILKEMPKSVIEKLSISLSKTHQIPDRLFNWIRGHIDQVGVAGNEVDFNPPENSLSRYWETLVDQLATIISQHENSEIPVIGIDELPFMLENLLERDVPKEDLTVTLASLRKLRDSGLRIILAGSISMENLLDLNGIPHTVLGGLWRELIPPFTEDEARIYLQENLKGTFASSSPVLDLILQELPDYVPEFLEICARFLSSCTDIEACKASIENDVLPAIRRSFIHQFDERLNKNYTNDELDIAEQILDMIARSDKQGSRIDGSQLPKGYRKVLVKLQFDNFIMDGADFSQHFTLQLLRQWWSASRGIQ